jgi:adenylylsulfate kinase-like enzyme
MIQTPPNPSHAAIVLITGTMASGKSSVAQALAERLPKSVHLRGDLFRRMIINGRADMSFDLSEEAERQLELRYALAVEVAKRYAQAGFVVVYQDIVIGKALQEIVWAFRAYQLSVVVLCPRPEIIAERDQARRKMGYPNRASIDAFDHILRSETPHIGYWFDNSDVSIAETVDAILSHLKLAPLNGKDRE